MARKRANGEGSYYQLKDRTWAYQVTVGRKGNGAPKRKSFKGRTKAICKERWEAWEAEQAASEERAAAERLGHFPEAEILFGDAFMEWLKLYKSPPTRKPSTYASYLATYETHFAPAFEKLPLHEITQDIVQDYYQKKQLAGARKDGKDSGLSPKTSVIIT